MELFSPPRITQEAAQAGLQVTEPSNFDLKLGWNALCPEDRKKMWKTIEEQEPDVILMSPDCKMFSQLMNVNLKRIPVERPTRQQMEALVMWHLCLQVAEHQMKKGRYFILEQPAGASSWSTHGSKWLMENEEVLFFFFDQCELGLQVSPEGLSRKTTALATNHLGVAAVMSQYQCRKSHEHEEEDDKETSEQKEELMSHMSEAGIDFFEISGSEACLMAKPYKSKSQEFNMKEATPEEKEGFRASDRAEFRFGKMEYDEADFAGRHVKIQPGRIEMNQEKYILEKLHPVKLCLGDHGSRSAPKRIKSNQGQSGLNFRDVVGPPWGEEMEEEAQEQDDEVRMSSYIDDEGYVHETEVRVRMVRIETEEERKQRDEDEESESSLTTDYGSLEGHIEPVGDYEHLEDDAYQAYRLEQIENDVGIEIYIIMKVRQFRQMMEEDPADEDIPTGYEMFRELQRMLMITGAETKKR
ncbi:Reverse transcriptase Ty1/copia-type domain-containing protein [Durusdinium trenchii]|uniref:Reverse transcriptase Ty1/copia-type domain-containing protein n=1 Tax=Durusdinium trenchii TaxID=1381693 RepID=A0ABP0QR07_9DINO